MIVEITDREAVAEIERRAAQTGRSVAEVVVEAVRPPLKPVRKRRHSIEEMLAAAEDLQQWYAAHHDPKDLRTPDEIVGYNEHGHFD